MAQTNKPVEITGVWPTLIVMFFAWLVSHASRGFTGYGRIMAWQPLTYIGQVSYGIYMFRYIALWIVWHGFALLQLTRAQIESISENRILHTFLLVAVTLACVVASWHLLEKTIIKLKSRFPYRLASKA